MSEHIRRLHKAMRLCVDLEEKVIALGEVLKVVEKRYPDEIKFPLVDSYCNIAPDPVQLRQLREVLAIAVQSETSASSWFDDIPFV